MNRLAIVVPCYNEEAVLPETAARLAVILDDLRRRGRVGPDSGVWFVDDGSRDATWRLVEELSRRDARFHGIKLSRNRGHQNALMACLLSAPGDVLISIDADLQDDLGAIEKMIDAHDAGHDLVYGVRESRDADTFFKRFTAEGYYRLLASMGVEVVFNHADYRLMSRRAIDALREFGEVNLFLRGVIPQLGFSSTTVRYARAERFAGESKYPLRRMLALALDGITSFSTVPLRLITTLGMIVALVSLASTGWIVWTRFFTDRALPGWASTVVPIYFLGGIQLFCIGLIGEYLAKVYMETKRRPRFFIERVTPEGGGAGPATTAIEALETVRQL